MYSGFELIGVFSRRTDAGTIPLDEIINHDIDVVLFCGNSNIDAPRIVPWLNSIGLSTIDCYDNQAEIANGNYINAIKSKQNCTVAIIGAGWSPGLLSINRILNKAIMPCGVHNTLYGTGLSMGHTTALKAIPDVTEAHQTTIPRKDAIEKALRGEFVPPNDRHSRICYIVAAPRKKKLIEKQIRINPYFANQQIEINFIGIKEFQII